jgi:hypothetical protein
MHFGKKCKQLPNARVYSRTFETGNPTHTMILSFDILEHTTPIKQFIIVLPISALLIVFSSIVSDSPETSWFVAVSALGFYVWANAVLGFFIKNRWLMYIIQSFVLFLVLGILVILLATYVSGLSLRSLREYQIMIIATFIFHVCGIFVCAIIKNVAELMEINY